MIEERIVIEKCEIEGFPTDHKLYIKNSIRDEYFIGRYKSVDKALLAATSVCCTAHRWQGHGDVKITVTYR